MPCHRTTRKIFPRSRKEKVLLKCYAAVAVGPSRLDDVETAYGEAERATSGSIFDTLVQPCWADLDSVKHIVSSPLGGKKEMKKMCSEVMGKCNSYRYGEVFLE